MHYRSTIQTKDNIIILQSNSCIRMRCSRYLPQQCCIHVCVWRVLWVICVLIVCYQCGMRVSLLLFLGYYKYWLILDIEIWERGTVCWVIENRWIKAKKYLSERVIVPTAVYGAEAWGMRRAERRKMNVLEMKCLRSLVGVSRMNRVRNEEVKGKGKVVYGQEPPSGESTTTECGFNYQLLQ